MATGDAAPDEAARCGAIERILSVLGRAWAGAVVEAMLAGNERFSDLARAVPGVTDSVLATRLRELCAQGLAVRDVAPGPPVLVTYRLTAAGAELEPVLAAIRAFAAAHPQVGAGA